MSRKIDAGVATVALLCSTFGISRAAYYASGKAPKPRKDNVVPLPKRPQHMTAEAALEAIRAVVKEEPAWGGVALILITPPSISSSLLARA
jgi:hypothetical protein